jgi:hypothetical protein
MITLTAEPPAAAAVRVDWMWTVRGCRLGQHRLPGGRAPT